MEQKIQHLTAEELDKVVGGSTAQIDEIKNCLRTKGIWNGTGDYRTALVNYLKKNYLGRNEIANVEITENTTGDNGYRLVFKRGGQILSHEQFMDVLKNPDRM